MAQDEPEQPNEYSHLLSNANGPQDRRLSRLQHEEEERSIVDSHVSKEEQMLSGSTVGERLPYNDYTTIDWLHDLVKDSYRFRSIHFRKGIRAELYAAFDSCSGWIAAAIIGTLTACVAFVVDVAEATVSDWKTGYCTKNPLLSREACCEDKTPLLSLGVGGVGALTEVGAECKSWKEYTSNYWATFAIYVGMALVYGVISSSATMLTKRSLPSVASSSDTKDPQHPMHHDSAAFPSPVASGKAIYMAAGSGIPEIKTILSGFIIPNFLDLKVLVVKAFGAIFAVATGMCLGKEGPFVHISTCVGYLVGSWFPKYRDNGRKMRELLSAACASGLSVAFGAPIGGVLFSYEEISTYFPRKVLWRAFLCSMFAAMVLKALNPTGTGKLVLFETNYGTSYEAYHYIVFVLLGVAGGIWGGIFCRANFAWSRWFRQYPIIKKNPVFEIFLVVLATALLQYPNPLTREPGDIIIRNLLVDCRSSGNDTAASRESWVCQNEALPMAERGPYIGWLVYGTLVKLILTTITFGCKVPSGVIIPALDAGALFGRLVGQIGFLASTANPGIFAMVGAAAFLAGVSRMTISLCVIMFELTGELEYVLPHMIAILVAKWTADALGREGVYDLAQTVLGHPFLDTDHALQLVQRNEPEVVGDVLLPPKETMREITVEVPPNNKVPRKVLEEKLKLLHRRGLMDAGLVLVQNGMLQGYLGEGELEFGLNDLGKLYPSDVEVRLLGDSIKTSNGHIDTSETEDLSIIEGLVDNDSKEEFDLSGFVDRTPPTINAKAPVEYAVEMFGKLGLRHLCVVEEGSGRLVGVVIKKRLVGYLETLH